MKRKHLFCLNCKTYFKPEEKHFCERYLQLILKLEQHALDPDKEHRSSMMEQDLLDFVLNEEVSRIFAETEKW